MSAASSLANSDAVGLAHCQAAGATRTLDHTTVEHLPSLVPARYRVNYWCKIPASGAVVATGAHDFIYVNPTCPAGQENNRITGQCQPTCSSRGPSVGSYSSIVPSGSVACVNGCEAMVTPNGDGTYTRTFIGGSSSHCNVLPNDCAQNGPGYVMNAGTGMCQPTPQECQENQVKDPLTGVCSAGCPAGMVTDANGVCKPKPDNCPPGNVRAPSGQCLPGEGQCAAGEARRANGTCGRDSDGDGQADDDDDDPDNDSEQEYAAGGDSCNVPPSCSGGAIACMQVKIQWRIDCNTRKDAVVSGGACTAMPVCTGKSCDALEYSQLLQQWRASCTLDKLLAKDGGSGEGGQPEWTKVGGMSQNPGAGENPDDAPRLRERELSLSDLDSGGFGGGGGSCPALITTGAGSGFLSGPFVSALASPPSGWCTFIGGIYAVMALSGAIAAVFIVAKGI